jgi:hypothetical protein
VKQYPHTVPHIATTNQSTSTHSFQDTSTKPARKSKMPCSRTYGPTGPMVPLPAAGVACWRSILWSPRTAWTTSCSRWPGSRYASQLGMLLRLLERIGDKCIVDAFFSFPFNPQFPTIFRHASAASLLEIQRSHR